MTTHSKILLIGKPNSGKSLLFNQLTGLRQKVANYPGVTVEVGHGHFNEFELLDLPGIYSFNSISKDEKVAIDTISHSVVDDGVKVIVCVLDATRLERSLVPALQVQALAKKHNKAIVFVLNMVDEIWRMGLDINVEKLSETLGNPVVAVSAKKLDGIAEFQALLTKIARSPQNYLVPSEIVERNNPIDYAKALAHEFGHFPDFVLNQQNQLDSYFINSFYGGLFFFTIMFLLFQSIFTIATPLMEATQDMIFYLGTWLTDMVSQGILSDFINEALFSGIGAFLVFVPQIMILTVAIVLLEDSGYIARAALICHKPLSYFGLSGRSFIPYLSSHACAVPAILAARTIESPRKRMLTMLTIPLTVCSGRLPVYAVLIALLVPSQNTFFGVFNLQGIAFFGLYLFGIMMALIVSLTLQHLIPRNIDQCELPFIIELPAYRIPHWQPILIKSLESVKQFIIRAAPSIFITTVIIWVLGYFPPETALENSWLGMMGKVIEPVFIPLGLDWRYGVAILMSFLSRVVFVSTLGTLFGMSNAEENTIGLAERLEAEGLTFGAGLGLVFFYAVGLQCVATVATLMGETKKTNLILGLLLAYGTLAYLIAFLMNWIF